MKFLFGADPELFVSKGGRFVSGHGLVPGDKKNPFPVKAGAVQVDGMALEFNINPSATEGAFIKNLSTVLTQLQGMVPEYELHALPCVEFDKDILDNQPKEALELGCEPDYNAWSGGINERPNATVNFRTGSGHVHIGWTNDANLTDGAHIQSAFKIARQMDFYLGLPSLLFDNDTKRRALYGKAGACRIKPYGVEYRVLSNRWLSSKELMGWVFRSAKRGMVDASKGIFLEERFGDVQDIINTSNLDAAMAIMDAAGLEKPM